jgi:hypothetical protein
MLMAVCSSCGTSFEGGVCPKCGVMLDPGQSQAPPKKKRTLFWVLGGCLGVIILVVLFLVIGGAYFLKKSGFDPKHPAQSAANVIVNLDHNLEIVSVDESEGIIRLREKSSGRIIRMNINDAQKGNKMYEDQMETPLPPGEK